MELQFAFSPVGFPWNKHLPVLPRPLPLGEAKATEPTVGTYHKVSLRIANGSPFGKDSLRSDGDAA